jgi:hypothetical protein
MVVTAFHRKRQKTRAGESVTLEYLCQYKMPGSRGNKSKAEEVAAARWAMSRWESRHACNATRGRTQILQSDPSPPNSGGGKRFDACMVPGIRRCTRHMLARRQRWKRKPRESNSDLVWSRREETEVVVFRWTIAQARYLFGEVTRVVGLFSAIGICEFLHTLGVIIIGAVTATPCRLRSSIST